jgi:Domain of unknown function (DUF4190)
MLQASQDGDGDGQDMSDTSQGPGWWLASDGKWYPPELWTGPPGESASGTATAPPYGPYGQYGQAPAPYGASGPPAYEQYPSGYGAFPPSSALPTPKTNGLAIAAFVCSCLGIFFLPIFPGVILGFVARSQIKRSGGAQKGDGLAIAAIIIGFGWLLLEIIGLAIDAGRTTTTGLIGLVGLSSYN